MLRFSKLTTCLGIILERDGNIQAAAERCHAALSLAGSFSATAETSGERMNSDWLGRVL